MRNELVDLAEGQFKNSNYNHNLNRREHNALIKFTKNHSIVLKKEDKATSIVVKNRKDYIREGFTSLIPRDIGDSTETTHWMLYNTSDTHLNSILEVASCLTTWLDSACPN